MGNQGPLGSSTNRPLVDTGTLAPVASPLPGIVGTQDHRQAFESAYAALRSELANIGFIGAIDGSTRAYYDKLLREFREEIYARVRKGQLSWRDAAAEARNLRDDVMKLTRSRSTPVGRAVAEWLKSESPTLNRLIAKKTLELFGQGADFTKLAVEQQNRVYAAIVESAGKSNVRITSGMRTVSRAGKGLLFVSLAISVYVIATADDKIEASKREGAVTGAGIAGGIAGGAIAGLACGPGAPVCVTIGAFVGGAIAAFGVDSLWR